MEQLTLPLGDFPAKSIPELATGVESSRSAEASCSNFSGLAVTPIRDGLSPRTSQTFFPYIEGRISRPSSKRWPSSGRGGVAWRVLRSEFFGLAQKRQRLFVVISTRDTDGAAKVLLDQEGDRRVSQTSEQRWQKLAAEAGISAEVEGWCLASAQAHAELVTGGLSPTLTTLHEAPIWVHPGCDGEWAVRRLTPDEYEVLMGFDRGWTRIHWKGRPPERCPDNKRYRAIGNSFPVPIIRWIGERIQEVDALDSLERSDGTN